MSRSRCLALDAASVVRRPSHVAPRAPLNRDFENNRATTKNNFAVARLFSILGPDSVKKPSFGEKRARNSRPLGSNPGARHEKSPASQGKTGLELRWCPQRGSRLPAAAAAPGASRPRTLAGKRLNAFAQSRDLPVRTPASRQNNARPPKGRPGRNFDGAPSGVRTRDLRLERATS